MRLLGLVLLVVLTVACSSSSAVGSACAAAGGTCEPGSGEAFCAKPAPEGAQDCTTNPPNPGGGFCCLDAPDGSYPPLDGGADGPADAAAQ